MLLIQNKKQKPEPVAAPDSAQRPLKSRPEKSDKDNPNQALQMAVMRIRDRISDKPKRIRNLYQ